MRTGVYIIRNKIDERIYIGSSIDIDKRVKRHKLDLDRDRHHSRYLQRFVNKYGIENLIFKIKEICDKDLLLIREQYYIDTLKPEFNINPLAHSCLGAKRSQEFKDKTSILTKGEANPTFGLERTQEWRDNISKANKGQIAWNKNQKGIYSEETINKMKEAGKLREFSTETRQKISEANSLKVYKYDLTGNYLSEFDSIKLAAKDIDCSPSGIVANCKLKSKTVKGHIYRYNKVEKLELTLTHKASIPIRQYTPDRLKFKKWESAKIAATILNINTSNISLSLKNKVLAYGYYWVYEKDCTNENNNNNNN